MIMLSVPSFNKAQGDICLRSVASERSFETSSFTENDDKPLVWPQSKPPKVPSLKPWKPLTQKAYFLIPIILASAAIITVLEVFLERSTRESGIIFASNINDLPLSRNFVYLYLPTIVSLILSFSWTWIDLDVKRLQPYFQLSRKQGALGKDSILLHYPFDFVASVPINAIRRRHWPVFSASVAVVIIFWGLTPLQSSIFATQTIHRSFSVPTISSTSYLSLQEQKTTLTGSYAQSVYNIAWLNETLQPFMTRNGMLAPFALANGISELQTSETWTAPTRYYSVDLHCEEPTYSYARRYSTLNSSMGCSYSTVNMGLPEHIKPDQYSSLYVGYWYEEMEDSYLENSCPDTTTNRTFLVRWSRGWIDATVPIENATLFCNSSYYQQDVNATISASDMSVADITATGPKTVLPSDMFNITDFEWSMSEGYELDQNRGDYPTSGWPSPYDRLCAEFPKLYWTNYLANMATFALGAYQRSEENYLDPKTLKASYQAAYRLLFARRMADILSSDLDQSMQAWGTRRYSTQSVIMVPVFVYIVEALIVVTALAAAVIFCLSKFLTKNNLTSEPASLASMMALSVHDPLTAHKITQQDRATALDLDFLHKDTTFALIKETAAYSAHIDCIHVDDGGKMAQSAKSPRYMLPAELSWYYGVGFLSLQIFVVAMLVYIYIRVERNNGLPLPSNHLFVNQLTEHYAPMVIAAFFEPLWTVINRNLCMLQPYEQLRKGNASPSKSISLDYNSLPPQAVIGRALKAGHISLVSVCLMGLFANVLSVALASLLYENTVGLPGPMNFTALYSFPINGSSLGNESLTRNRPSYDQYYVAMSNLTAGTSLPAWSDDKFFYLPFNVSVPQDGSATSFRANTSSVRVVLECVALQQVEANNSLVWTVSPDANLTTGLGSDILDCGFSNYSSYPSMSKHNAEAIEYITFNHTNAVGTCGPNVFAGWGRSTTNSHQGPLNASWVACNPIVEVGVREVTVDENGFVQSSLPSGGTIENQEQFFEPNSSSFIRSVHKMLDANELVGTAYTTNQVWHNDSYPSDFVNYLIAATINSSTFLDPELSPPSPSEMVPILEALYAKLFAIVLATNMPKVLRASENPDIIAGVSIAPTTRIFVSKPSFVISVTIMMLYVLVTVAIYIRRPWKILPRMPTTIASQMAFFAASHALQDFENAPAMSTKDLKRHVNGIGHNYGFGRFVGTDGKPHIGIEREPLVQILRREDLGAMQTKSRGKDKEEAGITKNQWTWLKNFR